ncbi:hypothetical protein [Flavobacterium sp.]|uniref:hypothetical protein n=1 Tax=Flavobacterium sp. TaxID=239 RepID=UPI001202AE15|nr:hypothetical protein [Flavobacterium sp.]RZJ69865.1 MAG: hypothetical protein EOO49_15650 [Flavobacterium sp.]
MKTETLRLSADMRDLALQHFRLLQSENPHKKRDTVELRLSGYRDVMHLIADIVKVSILALENGGTGERAFISDPTLNVSGVLSLILDLLPYEEADLLDKIRHASFEPNRGAERDWDFILRTISLTAPASLSEN